MIAARIIADSIAPTGARLTTMVVDCHRFVLAEVNTHRAFSRNSASSRAIPLAKRIEAVRTDPAMPAEWGRNQPGMQAETVLDEEAAGAARAQWLFAANQAANVAERMAELGLHKQVAARILEPYLWHRIVISATDWDGFWIQRCNPMAQPEMRLAAEAMRAVYDASTPVRVYPGGWHLPFVDDDEAASPSEAQRLSVARCARVSYLNEGRRDPEADLALYDRLLAGHHLSPFEHVARPATHGETTRGNFSRWHQLRHHLGLDEIMLASR